MLLQVPPVSGGALSPLLLPSQQRSPHQPPIGCRSPATSHFARVAVSPGSCHLPQPSCSQVVLQPAAAPSGVAANACAVAIAHQLEPEGVWQQQHEPQQMQPWLQTPLTQQQQQQHQQPYTNYVLRQHAQQLVPVSSVSIPPAAARPPSLGWLRPTSPSVQPRSVSPAAALAGPRPETGISRSALRPPQGKAVVVCFGDSLTRGPKLQASNGGGSCTADFTCDSSSASAGTSYPSALERLLHQAGHDTVVVNAGRWGDTCDQLISRLPAVVSEATKHGRLEAVLMLGGTNDILRGSLRPSDILTRLRQLHEMAGRAVYMPYVGVMTVPPTQHPGVTEQRRLQVNQGLREACQQAVTAPRWTPHGRQFLVDLEGLDVGLAPDGVHYGPQGCAEIASKAFEALLVHLPKTQVSAA